MDREGKLGCKALALNDTNVKPLLVYYMAQNLTPLPHCSLLLLFLRLKRKAYVPGEKIQENLRMSAIGVVKEVCWHFTGSVDEKVQFTRPRLPACKLAKLRRHAITMSIDTRRLKLHFSCF